MNEHYRLPSNLRESLTELIKFLSTRRDALSHWRPTQSLSFTRTVAQSAHTADRLIELIDTDGLVLAPPARLLEQIARSVERIDRERAVEVGLRERRQQLTALEEGRDSFVTFERLARAYAKLKLESIVAKHRLNRTAVQLTAQRELRTLLDSLETSLRSWSHLVEKTPQHVIVPDATLREVEDEVGQFCNQAADSAVRATESGLRNALMDLGECVDAKFAEWLASASFKEDEPSSIGSSAFEPLSRRDARVASVVG